MAELLTDGSAPLNLKLRRARAVSINFTFLDSDGAAFPITGKTLQLLVKSSASKSTSLITRTIGNGLTVTGSGSNILNATLSEVHTDLAPRTYYWEIYNATDKVTWIADDFEIFEGTTERLDTDVDVTLNIGTAEVTVNVTMAGDSLTSSSIISALGYTPAQSSNFVGLQDLWISAGAMWAKTTSGCAVLAKTEMTTSLVNIQTLDFDSSTQEFAQFTIALPRNWNNGTVTAKFYWTAASGSGGVVWEISGGAYSDDDALTVALGTAQTATDTLLAANDLHISPATSAITLAGTPADSDFLAFQISRNPSDGSDTLAVDAKLLGIMLTITTDAGVAS